MQSELRRAFFAGGCYWGVEYMMAKLPGVEKVVCGYSGGTVPDPTYPQVCTGTTGHAETVEVFYDPVEVSYEDLAKRFFEIIDTSSLDAQGPDFGEQYRSILFYETPEQKAVAEKLIGILRSKGYEVVTSVEPFKVFYAEKDPHHQNHYERLGTTPYCHFYHKKF